MKENLTLIKEKFAPYIDLLKFAKSELKSDKRFRRVMFLWGIGFIADFVASGLVIYRACYGDWLPMTIYVLRGFYPYTKSRIDKLWPESVLH